MPILSRLLNQSTLDDRPTQYSCFQLQANPQNAAVFAATGPADAPTPATTGEDPSGKLADHQKRNADAAPAGKIPDSTDKADSATQVSGINDHIG
jgi:hypothetical protein